MKQIAAIILIALFLFNLAGYQLVFNYAQRQADLQLSAQLDRDEYNEAELITLTFPVNMPYQIERNSFERVDGEVNYQGKIYKYVKRKMVDGQLVLLCLPDHNKMRLQSAKDDFFKTANDLVQNSQSKKSDHSKTTVSKKGAPDYIDQTGIFQMPAFLPACANHLSQQVVQIPCRPYEVAGQPPNLV